MLNEEKTYSDDIDSLKELIKAQDTLLKQKEIEFAKEQERANDIQQKYDNLKEKFRYLQKLFFGRKSERLKPEDELQGRLFNEAETSIDETGDESTSGDENQVEVNSDIITIKEYTRKSPGRKPIPAHIPRVEIIHELPDREKNCDCCGQPRPVIGREETEELDYIPAKVQVIKHITLKYGPCKCEEFIHSGKPEVICTPTPKRMLPGSIASEGLIAYVLTSKFCDALPFYRLSKMLKRIEVDISRANMCNWQISCFEKMDILFEVFVETLKSGEFIQMDETTVQVLQEEGRPAESKSYMWVAMGYPARGHPLVLYEYHPSRSKEYPLKFLKGFKGYLQTDGYKSYNSAVKSYELIHVGCMAHARREFYKAYDAAKKKNKRAHKVLIMIQRIYKIEEELRKRNLPDDEFVAKRKDAVLPVLDKLYPYLLEIKEIVTPTGLLGGAVKYMIGEWEKIIRYLDKAFLTPDNNAIERSIKSFVIGRKNWLFSNTPRGARSSAGMYSLIESSRLNGLDPYLYLRFLFSKLPIVGDDRDKLRELLPCFVTANQLKIIDGDR